MGTDKKEEKPNRKARTWKLLSDYQKKVLANQQSDVTYYPTDMTFPERVIFELLLDVYESNAAISELYGQQD